MGVPCVVRPHYDSTMEDYIEAYRTGEMRSGPCPNCTILRFPEGTAYYWAGDGSDVRYVASSWSVWRCWSCCMAVIALIVAIAGPALAILCAVLYVHLRSRRLLSLKLSSADLESACVTDRPE